MSKEMNDAHTAQATKKMKFSTDIPDIYYICHERFGVEWDSGVIFTYGDTVYSKYPIDDSLVVHEGTHIRQQAAVGGPITWWAQYLEDDAFRLSQELEAYKKQCNFIKKLIKDKNRRHLLIHKICRDLSGPMYGNIISYSDAYKKLS